MQLCLEHSILMIPKVPVHHSWGWDTAPCSTSSHHFPWTLNIPHLLLKTKLAQNGVRKIPTSCCILGLGRSLGNSCCGTRQNLFRRSLLPWEPSLASCRGDPTCPLGPALPRAQRLLCSWLPGRALAKPGPCRGSRERGADAEPAAVQDPQPHPAGTGDAVERSQEDFSLESPITASCLWAPSPQHATYSMKYERTEILTGTLLCYFSSQMEFMNCEIDFHFQECLNM